jgi:hypothetical protein
MSMPASKISYSVSETGSEGYVRSVRLGEAPVSKFLVMTIGENLLWPIQSVRSRKKNYDEELPRRSYPLGREKQIIVLTNS